jgi:hypothetical protein
MIKSPAKTRFSRWLGSAVCSAKTEGANAGGRRNVKTFLL